MQDYFAAEHGVWPSLLLALAVGTAVVVGLAALAAGWTSSALWRRTIWQVATLGLLALLFVELTGTGPPLARMCRWHVAATPDPPDTFEPIEEPEPAAAVSRFAERDTFSSPGFAVRETQLRGVELRASVPRRNVRRIGNPSYPQTRRPADSEYSTPATPDSSLDLPTAEPSENLVAAAPPMGNGSAEPLHEDPRWPAWIWLLGVVVIAGRIVYARGLLFVFRRRHAEMGDEPLLQRVGRLARRLGVRRPVSVLQAPGLRAPVAFGILRPTVALPAGFSEKFDPAQQEAMLAHELAHLAAGDPAWQLLADLLCAMLWWHPLVWWSRRCLRAAGEAAADEASLLVPDGPDVLAGCLVAMGRQLASARQLGWLSIGGSGFRSSLGRRVQRLLDLPKRSWRAPRRGRLALAKTVLPVTFVIVAVFCTAWIRPQATLAEGESTMNVWTVSWRRSLAAMAVAALISTSSGDAAADDAATAEPMPTVAGDNPFDGELVVLQEGDEERAEGEARERREVEERERHEVHEREQGERERNAVKLRQEMAELEERAGGIKREMGQLRDGQDAEARELQGVLREIDQRMQHIRREFGDREGPRREHAEREHAEREHAEQEHAEQEHREHAERERGERDRHVDELRHELGQLEEKAQHIKREIGDRGPDHDDEAHKLHTAQREIHQRMEQIRREFGDRERPERDHPERDRPERERHVDELRHEFGQLQQKARNIQRELGDRGPDQAPDAHAALREIHGRMEQIQRELHGPQRDRPRRGPEDERQRMMQHLEEVKREIGRLMEQGKHEEANRLEREAHEIMRHLKGDSPPHRPEGPERVVHELQGQIHELRREVQELRGLVKELIEHQRDPR